MKYNLTLKNEGHDIDDVVSATTAEEAAQFFADKHDIDFAEAFHNQQVVEDQPAEYQNE